MKTVAAIETDAIDSTDDLSRRSVGELQSELSEIDAKLQRLARYSLQSGVGAIGYRSNSHADAAHTEWVEIVLPKATTVDEVVLVPTILRDIDLGFTSEAFPIEFRILASPNPDENSADQIEIASFSAKDGLLPRIAPLVIPCNGFEARRIRVEANVLGSRKFDGRCLLQLSEILIFSGPDNVALHQTVRSSSNAPTGSPAWEERFLVDGFVPYSMHSASGSGSLAYVSKVASSEPPKLTIDLGSVQSISQIRLHLVDQSDTVPATFSGDFAVPAKLQLIEANEPDFADAVMLVEINHENDFDVGPIVERHFPPTKCRYLRLTAIDPFAFPSLEVHGTRFGFAEIEIIANGQNVALGKTFDSDYRPSHRRGLAALTDGSNLYGRILPPRIWLSQLAQRHDLETKRPLVADELNGRYLRQRLIVRALIAVVAMLVLGTIFAIFVELSQRQKAIAKTRDQIAADLHDELGANVSAIGLLSDLVQNAADSPEKLAPLMLRMRELTQRTSLAARYCTNMLESAGLCDDLKQDMLRTSGRVIADLKHDFAFDGEHHLKALSSRKRLDLFLFYKECLTNILQHSGATEVVTKVSSDADRVNLQVTDNGHGVADGSGFRVPPSLKRRARLLGGQVTAEHPASGGTTIQLSLRLKKQNLLTRLGVTPGTRT
ncbi:MAG: histidine kinase [Rubripirellula sp.]